MACTPTPTATLYATVLAFTPSTSYSQSVADSQAQVTTVQQLCVASGTINGSSVGCISTTQITEVNTLSGGSGQAAQIPIVVSVSVAETQPTQTLFAPCTSSDDSSPTTQTTDQSFANTPLTTSVLVQTTPPPSTMVETSSTTLADGSVVQTVVTMVTALPPTAVYVPTSPASPSLQNSASHEGTNVTAIVGSVLGGFLGLIAIVGSLWWLCRRRRTWDDMVEKEEVQNEDAWVVGGPARREHDGWGPDWGAEPRPYQYGLVGHVIPPAAAGEPLGASHHGSVSEHSGVHSRNTSLSAVPLLQGTRMSSRSSRPSTAGSTLTAQTQPVPRMQGSVGSPEMEARALPMAGHSNSMRRLPDGQTTPALLGTWTPNMDDLAVLEPLNRSGSPVSSTEQRVLQIVNDTPPSPADTVTPGPHRTSSRLSSGVIVHTDGGPIPEEMHTDPPPYSH